MAVTRYEWTCPGCGKRFAVREGLAPALCPACQEATGAAPREEEAHDGPPASRPAPFAAFDDLTDEFVSRPHKTPAARLIQKGPVAGARPVWTLDLRFERFLTPHLLRAVWLLAVVGGIGAAVLDIGMTASHAWAPQPTAANPPHVGDQVSWTFLLLIARLVAIFVAVVYVRVVCEAAIVIFRMADNLEAIREATDRQSPGQHN